MQADLGVMDNMKDNKRTFSKKQRNVLYLAADGKSDMSGEPLSEHWHADHILPWSKGGVTDVSNGQATNPYENLKKSDHILQDRYNWQGRLLKDYERLQSQDYMVAALPGAGKTRAALALAKNFLSANANRRLIVVVPTTPVRNQWRNTANKHFGLSLQTREFNGSLKTDFHGLVTTYAAIASEPTLFRRLCVMHQCFVIFDEIHHAGDKSTWGIAIQGAFENATRRLCLSGTPFKHDGQKIPFLKINPDGFYHIDFSYDYPSALRDGVVREVSFHRYKGSVEIAIGEEIFQFSTDDELNDDDAARRLRGLLQSPNFTKGMLRKAHEKLLLVRKSKPNAAGLVLCIDANHASRVAKLLEEITGEAPDIIVSDTDLATGNVDDFYQSTRKWIVAVRMVSEGVDIPRLMVLAYLTNTTTELFFRQAVGRIVRHEGTDFDTESYCFIPDDPQLAAHAAKIEEFQAQVIAEESKEEREQTERSAAADQLLMQVLGSSDASFAGITTRGSHQEFMAATKIRDLAEEFQLPEAKIAAIIERLASSPSQAEELKSPEPLEVRLNSLRRKCNKLAITLAFQRGMEPKDIHGKYMRIANIGQPTMTEVQLEAKIQWLLKLLSDQTIYF